MQKKEVFAEHPGLLEEDFRTDLKLLLSAADPVAAALATHISSVDDDEKLRDEKHWVELAKSTGATINDLIKMYRPIRYLCLVASREKADLSQLVSTLADKGLPELQSDKNRQRLLDLCTSLRTISDRAEAEALPRLPGVMIERMSTHTSALSEFDNEFDTDEDDPSSYTPVVKRLHVYTTLSLVFRDAEHERLNIALSEHHLRQLIKWLQLAEVQHRELTHRVSPEKK